MRSRDNFSLRQRVFLAIHSRISDESTGLGPRGLGTLLKQAGEQPDQRMRALARLAQERRQIHLVGRQAVAGPTGGGGGGGA